MPGKFGLRLGIGICLIVLGGRDLTRAGGALETADPDSLVGTLHTRMDSLSTAYDSLHAMFFARGDPEVRKNCVAQMAEVVRQIKSARQAWYAIEGPYLGQSFVVWDSTWADPYPAIEESLWIPANQFCHCKIRREAEMEEAGYAVRTTVLTCKGTWVAVTSARALDGSFAASDTAYVRVSEAPEIVASSPEGKPRVTCIYAEADFGREFFIVLQQEGRGFRIVNKGFTYGAD